ncbi:MAG: family efflux transporter subunit, HlyD family secretion protein [Parcubacteria group bacterium]|nr:family efflux transporter subunit, HlyD family secretion protein [Parcubacteria group bacterium]
MNAVRSILGKIGAFFKGLGGYAMRHKIQAGIAVLIVAGGGYYGYTTYKADHTAAQYVVAAASIAPIQTTVTGSGQVAASHQLDLAPKSSGAVTGIYVKAGDHVAAGQLVATVDNTDAQKTVRDALTSLQSAKISYAQSISSSNTSTQNASSNAFDAVVNDETVVPNMLTDLKSMIDDNGGLVADVNSIQTVEPGAADAEQRAIASYRAAVAAHDATVGAYRTASRTSSAESLLALTQSEYASSAAATQAVKDTQAFLTLVNQTLQVHNALPVPADLAARVTKINADIPTITSATTQLTSAQTSLQSSIQTLSSNTGTPLDVQSAQLSLTKAQNAYQDALDALANYSVRAPFAGTIAKVNVQKFDPAGGSIAAATLITDQQFAELSLNETDAAKVQAGQAATLTFDAIDGLTLNGTVAEIDPVGTVTQGVVSYSVKIGLGAGDSRVRPGMTVNATIVTASKAAALVVPSAAIKTQGNTYYVEVAVPNAGTAANVQGAGIASTTRRARTATSTAAFAGRFGSSTPSGAGSFAARTATVSADTITLKRVPVTLGLASDTMTEVLTGLKPGDRIVTQTIAVSGKTTTGTSAPSLLGGLGGNRAGATGGARTTGSAARTTGAAAAGRIGG